MTSQEAFARLTQALPPDIANICYEYYGYVKYCENKGCSWQTSPVRDICGMCHAISMGWSLVCDYRGCVGGASRTYSDEDDGVFFRRCRRHAFRYTKARCRMCCLKSRHDNRNPDVSGLCMFCSSIDYENM